MTTFKPTDEQLFDYYLGVSDFTVTQQIEDYLRTHPEVAVRLREFGQIEQGFKGFPITEPSARVLDHVRTMARRHAKPGILDFLKTTIVPRQLAWAVMVLVVVGLSYALRELRDTYPYMPGLATPKMAKTVNGDAVENGAAKVSGVVSDQPPPTLAVDQQAVQSFKDYADALGFYHQGKFRQASDLFGQIMTATPRFEKRDELYTYWVDALEKMGDKALADQKRQDLENLKSSQ